MKRRGFTLVELVIVIGVVAVLAAVLIPTFSSIIEKANKTKDLAEARNEWNNVLIDYPLGYSDFLLHDDGTYKWHYDESISKCTYTGTHNIITYDGEKFEVFTGNQTEEAPINVEPAFNYIYIFTNAVHYSEDELTYEALRNLINLGLSEIILNEDVEFMDNETVSIEVTQPLIIRLADHTFNLNKYYFVLDEASLTIIGGVKEDSILKGDGEKLILTESKSTVILRNATLKNEKTLSSQKVCIDFNNTDSVYGCVNSDVFNKNQNDNSIEVLQYATN